MQKLVQDLWVWENQVDAMGAFLERKVVAEAVRVRRTAASAERDAASEEQLPGLKFIAVDSGVLLPLLPERPTQPRTT